MQRSVEDGCQRAVYTYDKSGLYNSGRAMRLKWNQLLDGANQVAACAAPGGGVVGFEETYL